MRSLYTAFLITLLTIASTDYAFSQIDTAGLSSDELFTIGRELAFDGKREEARVYLNHALAKSPQYYDIKIFIARTFAWDGLRDTAVFILNEVLNEEPKNLEASLAILDFLYWDDKYTEALNFVNKQLRNYATNQDLLIRKAKILIAMDRKSAAALELEQMLRLNPDNTEAKELLKDLKLEQLKNSIGISYSIDQFNDYFGTAHYESLQYGRRTPIGSVNAKINSAQRFDTIGFQPEIDFYPSFGKGFYAYMNYGYTDAALFPDHRVGLELYKNLPLRLETSLGLRYLSFGPASDVTIYTGSLGWYVGNWWLNGRTYITPDADLGTFSRSLTLRGRRYFSNAQNYLGFSTGFGFSPDADIQSGSGFTSGSTEVYFLGSHKISLEGQATIGDRFTVGAGVGWSDLELSFDRGKYVQIFSGQMGVSYIF